MKAANQIWDRALQCRKIRKMSHLWTKTKQTLPRTASPCFNIPLWRRQCKVINTLERIQNTFTNRLPPLQKSENFTKISKQLLLEWFPNLITSQLIGVIKGSREGEKSWVDIKVNFCLKVSTWTVFCAKSIKLRSCRHISAWRQSQNWKDAPLSQT